MGEFSRKVRYGCLAALSAAFACSEPTEGFPCSRNLRCPWGYVCASNSRCYRYPGPKFALNANEGGSGGGKRAQSSAATAGGLSGSSRNSGLGGSGGAAWQESSGGSEWLASTSDAGAGFGAGGGNKPVVDSSGGTSHGTSNLSGVGGINHGGATGNSGGQGNRGPIYDCNAEQSAKITRAIAYLATRSTDGKMELAACLNRAYFLGVESWSGSAIVGMLASLNFATAHCKSGNDLNDDEKAVRCFGDDIEFSAEYVSQHDVLSLSGAIAHAALHSFGYADLVDAADPHFKNGVAEQGRACITKWQPNPAADRGFVRWAEGALVANDPNLTLLDATAACQAADLAASNEQSNECFFDGARIGYELYHFGEKRTDRVRFEPNLTRAAAIDACNKSIDLYPTREVLCRYRGERLGYELYFNGSRAGREIEHTRDQSLSNCNWNIKDKPITKVECFLDGVSLGYSVFIDGRRFKFEPSRGQSDAASDCRLVEAEHPLNIVECWCDGVRL